MGYHCPAAETVAAVALVALEMKMATRGVLTMKLAIRPDTGVPNCYLSILTWKKRTTTLQHLSGSTYLPLCNLECNDHSTPM